MAKVYGVKILKTCQSWQSLRNHDVYASRTTETQELSLTSSNSKTDRPFRYRHPYEDEILQLQYPQAIYEQAEPILYLPADTTSATFVDTYEGVLEMLAELRGAKEIAVDLEHHDTRSYVGLVSLMQISTREKDWIVDTLKPWRQDLQVLNEVFADPAIIKVIGIRSMMRLDTNILGLSRCLHGYSVVAERFRSLHCWSLRHSSCL